METNIVISVLMGLPGAGKTTLCEALASAASDNPYFDGFIFIHVCFDTLIPLSLQEKFVEDKKAGVDTTESWKQARHEVYLNVDKLLSCLKTDDYDFNVFKLFNVHKTSFGKDSKVVILLDDNFYYRSMRYEYFQLARKHTVGFMQVYIDIDYGVAIKQNLNRTHTVPEAAIYNMAQKFQHPKPRENRWEDPTFVTQSSGGADLKCFGDMVLNTMSFPVLPVENNESEKEEARLICSRNVAHQADLYLRSLVGKTIKEAHKKGSTNSKEFSARVNAARQYVMVSVRKGSLLFPPNLADNIDDNNRESFVKFILEEFQKSL
ncbi:L-seryl-tRNA(Sec) kinase-like [Palaemon carinicauda]|uniref:L-seryl-tRNA(Sec) kinase-like n=1 Tax=Palaemon carinicauda TaxID=392227 RepID=UPI0035B5C0C7